MGNGFFLGWCGTVISFGNGPDSHSLGKIHSLQVALCLMPEEWSRFSNQGQTFLREDSFSPGYTLSSVGGMARGREWYRLRNHDIYSSLLEKNSPDSSSLMFYLMRADALPRSHICEWKNGPDDSVYIITLFLCRLMSDDCYEDCMSLDSKCILLWWMCSTVCDYTSLIKYLCATWCGSVPLDYSCVLLWIDIVVFY
jgi:hypothetical protein